VAGHRADETRLLDMHGDASQSGKTRENEHKLVHMGNSTSVQEHFFFNIWVFKTGTGHPERLVNLYPWRYSKFDYTRQ